MQTGGRRPHDSADGSGLSSKPYATSSSDSEANTLLYRELRGLRFENPGNAVALASAVVLTTSSNEGRRRSTRRRKQVTLLEYTPHHDEDGRFVKPDGTTVKLCDCLKPSCPGCHVPCKQCSSRMCGPACQKGRDFAPLVVGCECDPVPPVYHPFLEKEEKCDCPCRRNDY